MWTIIEECLNPPVVWERERAVGADGAFDVEAGFYTLPPFTEPEVFDFPEGIGPSSASTSSTRRCSSCRAGSRPTRSPSSTAWARR